MWQANKTLFKFLFSYYEYSSYYYWLDANIAKGIQYFFKISNFKLHISMLNN